MNKVRYEEDACLPDEIVEQILLRLPLLFLRVAKRVCKRWKKVMDSTSFARSYTGSCTGFTSADISETTTSELVDGCNNTMTVAGAIAHCGKAQILWAYSRPLALKLKLGNLVTNKWQDIPRPPCQVLTLGGFVEKLRAFALGGDRYRLVYWHQPRICIFTFEQGQWARVGNPEPREEEWSFYPSCTRPLVLNNTTMVSFDCDAMKLIEYSIHGSFSSRPVQTDQKLNSCCTGLVEWQCKLYFVTVAALWDDDAELQVRAVSAERGSAVLVSNCKIRSFAVCTIQSIAEDKNLLHCVVAGADNEDIKTYEIQYDMEKKCLLGDPKLVSDLVIHNQWRFN